LAAVRGKLKKLQKVRQCAKKEITRAELNELLLGTGILRWTVWHLAATSDNSETLQKVYQCAKDKLTREEINEVFLSMYK
jgi:hypothetical protein